jgi:1,4-dihydroxy-2-naphthoate polyprenyltransferase
MRRTLSRWARFLSFYIPDDYFSVIVGIAMAWSAGGGPDFLLRAVLLLVGAAALSLFIHGSDNIAGFHNGVDKLARVRRVVTTPSLWRPPAAQEPKLLVTGEIGMREATLLTGVLLVVTVAISAYFVVTSPWSGIVLGLFVLLFTAQYSVGLRFSYHGIGEIVVLAAGMGTPVAYTLLTGEWAWSALLVGLMVGLFHAAMNVNSNHADYEYDKPSGRRTLAVHVGLRRNCWVAVGLVAASWLAFASALATRALPAWAIVGSVLVVFHWLQLRRLFGGDPVEARRLAFGTMRLMFVIVSVSFVLQGVIGPRAGG